MTYNSSFDIIHISDEELFLYLESEKSMKNLIKETVIYKKLTSRIYDEGEPLYNQEVGEKEVNAIEIPHGATNGDMIKAMFPSSEVREIVDDLVYYTLDGYVGAYIPKKWWNAPYKKVNANG